MRGHQVRKQYKKVVWSVSIVEKVILRWRRKGAGLRGFRVQKSIENAAPEIEIGDEYEFLRLGRQQKVRGVEKALARVKSMARDQEARDQYMRLATKFGESKVIFSTCYCICHYPMILMVRCPLFLNVNLFLKFAPECILFSAQVSDKGSSDSSNVQTH